MNFIWVEPIFFPCSFLAGESAREWGMSKGIVLPETIAEAEAVYCVLFHLIFFVYLSFQLQQPCMYRHETLNRLVVAQICLGLFTTNIFFLKQWLVTEKAKAQWLRYKSMLLNAKRQTESSSDSNPGTTKVVLTNSGVLLFLMRIQFMLTPLTRFVCSITIIHCPTIQHPFVIYIVAMLQVAVALAEMSIVSFTFLQSRVPSCLKNCIANCCY